MRHCADLDTVNGCNVNTRDARNVNTRGADHTDLKGDHTNRSVRILDHCVIQGPKRASGQAICVSMNAAGFYLVSR
jgi:hypothetical protein